MEQFLQKTGSLKNIEIKPGSFKKYLNTNRLKKKKKNIKRKEQAFIKDTDKNWF